MRCGVCVSVREENDHLGRLIEIGKNSRSPNFALIFLSARISGRDHVSIILSFSNRKTLNIHSSAIKQYKGSISISIFPLSTTPHTIRKTSSPLLHKYPRGYELFCGGPSVLPSALGSPLHNCFLSDPNMIQLRRLRHYSSGG